MARSTGLSLILMTTACGLMLSCGLRSSDCTEPQARVSRLEARLSDWASLSRYREANADLQQRPGNDRRVVFLGDSITDLWDEPGYGGFFPGKPYVNRGISSQTTPQMLIRFRPDVVALKPRVVVILAGTNDIAAVTGPTTLQAIEDNLASMAELARVHDIRVVLASLLPINDYEQDRNGKPIIHTKNRPPDQIVALNDRIQRYAADHGHVYLDYFSAMVDERGFLKDELTNDGIHANDKGYAVMAPLAEAAIERALAGASSRNARAKG